MRRWTACALARFFNSLTGTLSPGELTVLNPLAAHDHQQAAAQYANLLVTLFPTAPEMLAYPISPPAAALSATRALERAASAAGAQAVCAYVVLTVIPHFEPFDAAIGTELSAPAALGLLLEAVRAALKSPTAALSLGNVARAAEAYKYLVSKLLVWRAEHMPPGDRVTRMLGELEDRRTLEASSRSSGAGAGADQTGGGDKKVGALGYAQQYVSVLCDILADATFIGVCATLTGYLDGDEPLGTVIETILEYRGVGHAILHHALRGYVDFVRDLPLVTRIADEVRPHGPQWAADAIARLSLPPEADDEEPPLVEPLPQLWDDFCRAQYHKSNLEDAIYSVVADGQNTQHRAVPYVDQYTHLGRMRRTERTAVPWFALWGFPSGEATSLDALYSTEYAYYEDATNVPAAMRIKRVRASHLGVLTELSARDAAVLSRRNPGATFGTSVITAHSNSLRRLQRARTEVPSDNRTARAITNVLGATKAQQLGLGTMLTPEGMEPRTGGDPRLARSAR